MQVIVYATFLTLTRSTMHSVVADSYHGIVNIYDGGVVLCVYIRLESFAKLFVTADQGIHQIPIVHA